MVRRSVEYFKRTSCSDRQERIKARTRFGRNNTHLQQMNQWASSDHAYTTTIQVYTMYVCIEVCLFKGATCSLQVKETFETLILILAGQISEVLHCSQGWGRL